MDERLHDILTGKEDNYVLPFYWMHEGNTGRIPADIAKIYESGCRALCVESRPYEHFCGEPWWRDLGIVIDEARRRDMKVWILDDKHYPTGFANGLMEKYPDRRRQYLREYHADVIGPALGMSFLVPVRPDETLLRVCAYRRSGRGEELTGSPVVFDTPPQGGRIYWDVPEGVWRMFISSSRPMAARPATRASSTVCRQSPWTCCWRLYTRRIISASANISAIP